MSKPILKWVGGKTQIIDKVMSKFPEKINTYHEIFLGGGSVLIALLSSPKIKAEHVFAYDINKPLIGVYKNVQAKPAELYDMLSEIISEFMALPLELPAGIANRKPTSKTDINCRESYYYWTRICFNKLTDAFSLQSSVYFIFLNKTCFRGIYRTGPNGFNVPYGNYKKPTILERTHLFHIHALIQPVTFECLDFEQTLIRPTDKDDFVYLDPPYVPVKKNSFVYDGFDKHDTLFELCKKLPCPFLMSNSNTEKVRTSFSDYTCEVLETKCSINSKNPESKQSELMIIKL
jgi:DNA adenine methylase